MQFLSLRHAVRNRSRTVLLVTAGLLLASSAFAAVTWGGFATTPVGAPAPATFGTPVLISPGLFGDTVLGIEVGRDSYGPFVGIAVNVNPANPGYAAVTGASAGFLDPGVPAGAPLLYAAGPPVSAQIYYRPTHDPVHPGWGPGFPGVPAGSSVMDNSMQTCLLMADQLNAALRAPIPPAPPFTGVLFVLDAGPTSPTALEAFQIQIIR